MERKILNAKNYTARLQEQLSNQTHQHHRLQQENTSLFEELTQLQSQHDRWRLEAAKSLETASPGRLEK